MRAVRVFVLGLVVVTSGWILANEAWAGSATNLSVTPTETGATCDPISTSSCFEVDSLKNITHIFVAFDSCEPEPPKDPFTITVDGEEIPADRLHRRGGPCNHGPSAEPVADDQDSGPNLIEKPRFWFPLTGNQKHATVCVTNDALTIVRVGAKSADECVQDSVSFCEACDGRPCPNKD